MSTAVTIFGRGSPSATRLAGRLALHAGLALGSIIMVAPFVVMVVVSLVPTKAFLVRDFGVEQFTLSNYVETFRTIPFGRYYFNSALVAISVTGAAVAASITSITCRTCAGSTRPAMPLRPSA